MKGVITVKRYKLMAYMTISFFFGWYGFYYLKYLELYLKMSQLIGG